MKKIFLFVTISIIVTACHSSKPVVNTGDKGQQTSQALNADKQLVPSGQEKLNTPSSQPQPGFVEAIELKEVK